MRFNHYIAHLRSDDYPLSTACGEPWQGWQATEEQEHAALRGGAPVLSPHFEPKRGDEIRQCKACISRD